jgi:hypothetical protein
LYLQSSGPIRSSLKQYQKQSASIWYLPQEEHMIPESIILIIGPFACDGRIMHHQESPLVSWTTRPQYQLNVAIAVCGLFSRMPLLISSLGKSRDGLGSLESPYIGTQRIGVRVPLVLLYKKLSQNDPLSITTTLITTPRA